MLDKISNSILLYMEKDGAINKEIRDVYDYGIKVLLVNIMGLFVSLTIGIALSSFLETVVFLLVFATIRRLSGGYHANTFGNLQQSLFLLHAHMLFPM